MSKLTEDLPPEVRDQEDLIADGLIDEIEALEEIADAAEGRLRGGVPANDADKAEPAPETL